MHNGPDLSRRLTKNFKMMAFIEHLDIARLDIDMPYYGIIRSKNNSTPQPELRDILPTGMTSTVILSLMADEHCEIDTRSQYAEMLMSASRTQGQVNKAF